MRPLSEKIAGVVESATIAISNRAKKMQARWDRCYQHVDR